jgi:outer membrane protein assembly factor BamA
MPLLVYTAYAQQMAPAELPEVSSLTLEGNENLTGSELLAQMKTQETPRFLSRLFGWRKKEFFDPIVFEEDINRLRRYYVDHGFHDVGIDTSLAFSEDNADVDARIHIREGYQSIIDTIAFVGIVNVPEFIYEDMRSDPRISMLEPYNRALLDEEVLRVRKILWDGGYPNARFLRDSSYAEYRTSTHNYRVVLAFVTGRRYLWGDIRIKNELDSLRQDITDDIILQQLDYKPGDVYSTLSLARSEQNLNRVGVFDQANIRVTVPSVDDSSIYALSDITVRPRDRHELAPELVVSDESKEFNLGAGLGYANRNFLGGARTFSTKLRFRTQTIKEFPRYFDVASDAVSNIDLTFELLQPYIFTNRIKGNWSFSLIRDKQKLYRQDIVRNKFAFTDKFAEYTSGLLEWTLERVQLERNPQYPDSSSDPARQEQINKLREQAKNVQFNSILSFTIQRDKTNDLFRPSEGFVHSLTVQESGLLPLLLRRAQPDLPFTQFYSVTLLGRWYHDMSDHRYSIFAMKLKAGYEDKYGESRSDETRAIPPTYRFYGGGGGSVRGWKPRDLSATGDPLFGGNLSLEGSFELRVNVLQSLRDNFFDKIWIVSFVDVGNVWDSFNDLGLRSVAMAAGIGFRYDTFFGPFRIDYGFRVYNPAASPGEQWITDRKLFGQTLKEGILHFGIGHAF